MSTRATSTFEITGWEQTAYDEPADGPQLARATVKKTFSGDLSGTSTAELLMCGSTDGSAGYIASERVEARLGDRLGSFVIQHGGIRGSGTQETFGNVVPGSGRGELRGLRGKAQYLHDDKGATFTLDYDFD